MKPHSKGPGARPGPQCVHVPFRETALAGSHSAGWAAGEMTSFSRGTKTE